MSGGYGLVLLQLGGGLAMLLLVLALRIPAGVGYTIGWLTGVALTLVWAMLASNRPNPTP